MRENQKLNQTGNEMENTVTIKQSSRILLIFDLECNGLLDNLTKIHSLVIKDYETKTIYSCTDNFYVPENYKLKLLTIKDGIKLLSKADLIVGHNIIKYDIPAIKNFTPILSIKNVMTL